MEYFLEEVTIGQLIRWLDKKEIDLNPSYQRNFIWSPKDQSELIDTILKGFPLPNFFLYKKKSGSFEMVDGQQRTTTIYNFVKGRITSSKKFNKSHFSDVSSSFLDYRLPVVFLKNIKNEADLNEFYVLINKKGKQLNAPEVNKSEYYDKKFLQLANELLTYQKFIDLDLFTELATKRMNDRAYVEELLALLKLGVKDKKDSVNLLLENDISSEDYEELKKKFSAVINEIHKLNEYYPLKLTRYKQKNDFYTFFSFVEQNLFEDKNILQYQYRILLVLDGKDQEGRQLIRPTNEECAPLKEYAINCVSQSNSKNARLKRLEFFNLILKNTNTENNEDLQDVLNYLVELYDEERIDLREVGGFQLLDLNKIENA